MTSEAYVWVWLPGRTEPVVAGRLSERGDQVDFNYGRSYLEREEAIPLYLPELPLRAGVQEPLRGLRIAGCINDAGPDAWGQRVIEHRLLGSGSAPSPSTLGPLSYLLESGSDRIGALDFQTSATSYVPRQASATLDDLASAARHLEEGIPLPDALERALLGGSSVGGARPKALLDDGSRKLIAKFASLTDTYAVVRGEFVAMTLAARAGLNVAAVQITESAGRAVLLVERFDRPKDGSRRIVISGLTMMGLTASTSHRDASYLTIVQRLREDGATPKNDLRELFARITFNVLVGNTDDHARNHAAFWDGRQLRLSPAYDICPLPRAGGETNQAMKIGPSFRRSQLAGCVHVAGAYLLSEREARAIIDHQAQVIRDHWDDVTAAAGMSNADKTRFWGTAFLNPYAFYGYDDGT